MLEDVTVKYELFLQEETASPIPGRLNDLLFFGY